MINTCVFTSLIWASLAKPVIWHSGWEPNWLLNGLLRHQYTAKVPKQHLRRYFIHTRASLCPFCGVDRSRSSRDSALILLLVFADAVIALLDGPGLLFVCLYFQSRTWVIHKKKKKSHWKSVYISDLPNCINHFFFFFLLMQPRNITQPLSRWSLW